MKSLTLFLATLSFAAGCNQSGTVQKEKKYMGDTIISSKPADPPGIEKKLLKIDTAAGRKVDTALLLNSSEEILNYIKNRNYEKLAEFFHPQNHVRFSPYSYIDTVNDKVLSAVHFLQLAKQKKRINWNSAWEEGTELLTVDEYFKKLVYDVDFLNAELKSINDYHSQGTDLNNIKEVYPGYDVVEFFFPGFDEKYEGLDFRALRLVYNLKNKRPLLVGIIHDQWTP